MTDQNAISVIEDPEQEAKCLEYLTTSVQAQRAIAREVTGDEVNHEAEPTMLAALLTAEILFLNSHWWKADWPEEARETTALCVGCSDIFAWGCADAESLQYNEIEDLYDHWQRDPEWGAAVWCIKKRKAMPQKPVADAIRNKGIWDLDALLAPAVQDNKE
jgi:hypothetical protein